MPPLPRFFSSVHILFTLVRLAALDADTLELCIALLTSLSSSESADNVDARVSKGDLDIVFCRIDKTSDRNACFE